MIWSFVVNNYLMGKEPFPFDLLYWNDDSTNMPAAMHGYYLKNMYRDNLLCTPNGLKVKGVDIDVSKIKTPSYFLSTKDDHIAPWKATYAATQLFDGPLKFTLAASGHIAGVINPPDKKKYCYWSAEKTPRNPQAWFENAKETAGSWWPDWNKWMKTYNGSKVAARKGQKTARTCPRLLRQSQKRIKIKTPQPRGRSVFVSCEPLVEEITNLFSLTFRPLLGTTRFVLTNFLTLNNTCITCQHARFLQGRAHFWVKILQST